MPPLKAREAQRQAELDPDGDGSDQVGYIIPAAFATFIEIIGDKVSNTLTTDMCV